MNYIVYIGLVLKVLNTYFGFFYRLLTACYVKRRLAAFAHKLELRISNSRLAQFGYRNIRSKLDENGQAESIVLTGETYEYMVVSEKSLPKLTKCLDALPAKERVELLDLNKLRIENQRQVKALFASVDKNLPLLRYFTI
jgi:hypothetical protein